MIAFEAPYTFQSDYYDLDDVELQDSPPLKPFKLKLQPTPSPPPDGSESDDAKKPVLSEEDAVLIDLLGDGRAPEVARIAATELLPSDHEWLDESDQDGLLDKLFRVSKKCAKQDGEKLHSGNIGRNSDCPMCRLVSFEEFLEPSSSNIVITEDLSRGGFSSNRFPLGTLYRYVIEKDATIHIGATGKLITDRTINASDFAYNFRNTS